jgi:lipopolysaccharide export system protein LptA
MSGRWPAGLVVLAAATLAIAVASAGPARAQSLNFGQGESDSPIEVFADNGIEWEQDAQIFTARGNARAVRGEVEVRGDVLRAYYDKADGGTADIKRLDAEGHVRITTPGEEAFGDKAIYDVGNAILVLKGRKVRLVSATDTITADRQLELWERKQMAVARGNAYAVREDRRLRADVLTAHYRPDEDGKSRVYRVEAFGNVHIVTADETVTADRGVYNTESSIATLTGSVKITRDLNQLNGCSATVNLKTGKSRLHACAGAAASGQRVRGLIHPRGVKNK